MIDMVHTGEETDDTKRPSQRKPINHGLCREGDDDAAEA